MGQTTSVDLSTPEAVEEVTRLAQEAEEAAEAGNAEPTTEPEAEATTEPASEATEAPSPEGLAIPEDTVEEITQGLDMEALGQEYASEGQLSDASRQQVLDALSPQFGDAAQGVLDSYLAGIDAQAAQSEASAHEAAGGKDAFAEMVEWAQQNYTEAQRTAYNNAVSTPGYEAMAVRDLRAQFEAANGRQDTRVGSPAVAGAAASGVGPITSMRQLSELVSSDKYANDSGYRAQVDAQIAAASKR